MTDIHQTSNLQASQQKPLVYTAWDLQNVKLKQNKLFDFANNLLDFARAKGCLDCPRIYYSSQHKNQASAKKTLDKVGFKGHDVPDPSKNSLDKQLIVDCINRIALKPSPDIFIFVLGDWDFAGLICVLRALGKKVIVFAQQGSESKKLPKIVDEFHFVDELPKLIVRNNQHQRAFVEPQITYTDATEYLLEAIKTASIQGKGTSFPLIDTLMRQQFSNYRGASSICKHDGKPFSRFGKFINAAVLDGKVRRQNQELFLIE